MKGTGWPGTVGTLRQLQLERVRWTLRHAGANSPFYRERLAGAAGARLDALEDLARLPFTTKEDLRSTYPFGMFAVSMPRIARIHASSGTTGRPTVVGYSRKDLRTWSELVARSIRAAGGRPGMMVHIAYGYGLFTGGLGAHYGAERLGCTVIPISGGQTERQVRLLWDFRPQIIMVTPSYMLELLDEFGRQGVNPRDCNIRYGLFGAEPWSAGIREEIEDSFGLQATDIYGLSEVMGPGVAQEFVGTQEGPTLWEDHFFPEVIDPDTGQVLPDGTEGELVLTTLTKEALPLIRYRTRDLTRLLPGTQTPMRRLAKVRGRSDDMLIIRGVNVFPTQIEEQIAKCPGLSPHFLVEVSRPSRSDKLVVRVEERAGYGGAPIEQAPVLARHIKEVIGLSADVIVEAPGTLPRSQGKAVRVRDLRRAGN